MATPLRRAAAQPGDPGPGSGGKLQESNYRFVTVRHRGDLADLLALGDVLQEEGSYLVPINPIRARQGKLDYVLPDVPEPKQPTMMEIPGANLSRDDALTRIGLLRAFAAGAIAWKRRRHRVKDA